MDKLTQSTAGAMRPLPLLNKAEPVTVRELTPALAGCTAEELLLQLRLRKRANELMVLMGYTYAIAYRVAVREAMINGEDVVFVSGVARYIRPTKADGRATV